MEKEKRLVTLSLCILFFSIIVIYALFYQVKGEEVIQKLGWNTTKTVTENAGKGKLQPVEIDLFPSEEDTQDTTTEWDNISDTSTDWYDAIQTVDYWVQDASTVHQELFEEDSIKILPWTDLYFGSVDSIALLWLEPEYILKDSRNFYYSRFNQEPNVKRTVQQLNGNIYNITTESELVKNQLFGDKISFINIPEYKNKTVVMLLEINWEYWIIQMDYNKYHQSKNYLKNLFM